MLSLLILWFGEIVQVYVWLWLWLLFLGSIFNIIICSIWLAVPDEILARFIAVVYLIINLSAGWGTFPSFMQGKFFDILLYITPFHYGLYNIGAIIYGLSSPITVGISEYQIKIIKNMVILFIWVIIFATIRLVGTYYRFLKIKCGTFKIKVIYEVMNHIDSIKDYKKNTSTLNYLTKEEQTLIKAEVFAQLATKQQKKKLKKQQK